jgi:hypothetical protein
VLTVSGLMLVAIATAVVVWPSGWVGAVAATLGLLVLIYWTMPGLRASAEPIYPIYDRRIVRDARRDIESLLAHPGPTLDPVTCRALELLVQDLDDAAGAGARFCWMPISAWSGVIETNLRLYLG